MALTFSAMGSASPVLEHRYLHGPAGQVLVDDVFNASGQSTDSLWMLADHLGTPRDIVDDNGVPRKHVDYDSVGQITGEQFYSKTGASITSTHAEAIDQAIAYTGAERDATTGLLKMGRRWYAPSMARFTSEDPTGLSPDPNLYRAFGNSFGNYIDPTGTTQAGNPLNNLFGGYSGGLISPYKPLSTAVASSFNSSLSLGTLGKVTASSLVGAASSYVLPNTRAALSAGVSLVGAAATGVNGFSDWRSNNLARHDEEYQARVEQNERQQYALLGVYGQKAFKEAEVRQYRQIRDTEMSGLTLTGISAANTRLEDDVLRGVTGLTRTEAAVGLTKTVIRATGQDIVRSDEWFAAQPGTRYVEAGIGIASNPLTYAPFVSSAISRARAFTALEDVGAVAPRGNFGNLPRSLEGLQARIDTYANRAQLAAFDKGLSGLEAGNYADRYFGKAVSQLDRRLVQTGSDYRILGQYGRDVLGGPLAPYDRPGGSLFLDAALTDRAQTTVFSGWDTRFQSTPYPSWNTGAQNAAYVNRFQIQEGFVREISVEASRP